MGGSKYQTVGYKYFMGAMLDLCLGPIDKVLRIRADEKVAFQGEHSGGPLDLGSKNWNLFGGEEKEGGIGGTIDFRFGGPDQGQSPYLLARTNGLLPAYRATCAAVLERMYIGTGAYPKPMDFQLQRIFKKGIEGEAQWYPEKAGIPYATFFTGEYESLTPIVSMQWKYFVEDYGAGNNFSGFNVDDSSWGNATLPVGNTANSSAASLGFPSVPALIVPLAKSVWLRAWVYLDDADLPFTLSLDAFVDNGVKIWVNGHQVVSEFHGDEFNEQYEIDSRWKAGLNLIAMNVYDDLDTWSGDRFFFALKNTISLRAVEKPLYDMNPAHIIREIITDPDYGMGYTNEDIDEDSFIYAADVLYDEKFGLSFFWEGDQTAEDVLKKIVQHIDASLYISRQTGKFVLKLHRGDYDVEDLPIFDVSNSDSFSDYSKNIFGELTTTITVNYWNEEIVNTSTVTVSDTALVQDQGREKVEIVTFDYICNAELATRVGWRELKLKSSEFISGKLNTGKAGKQINPGDCFILNWPEYKIENLVMRCNGVTYSDGKSNKITLSCVQDIFSLPDNALFVPPTVEWEDTNQEPQEIIAKKVFELPYYEMAQRLGNDSANALLDSNPDAGYVAMAAGRPQSNAQFARMYTDNGAGFQDVGTLDFCPFAQLDGDLTDRTLETFSISNLTDSSNIEVGSIFWINDEAFELVSISTTTCEAKRGCLDTLPQTHSDGDYLIFADTLSETDPTEYIASDEIDVKLAAVTSLGEMEIGDITANAVILNSRAIRPYPPANVKLNGEYWPSEISGDLEITARERNRLTQAGGTIVDFFEDSDVTGEAGQTYSYELYNSDTDDLIDSDSGLTSFPINISEAALAANNRLELFSIRDGYESWQRFVAVFEKLGLPTYFYNSDYMISSGFETVYGPCSFYDAATDRTYVTWQFANPFGSQRKGIRVAYYDHDAEVWSDRYTVGNFELSNDDHGAPAIVKDADGYLYVFFGAHVTTQKWAVSNSPDDISGWTVQTPVSGSLSYPQLVEMSGVFYLFNRNDANINQRTGIVRSGTPSGGSVTFGSPTTLVDLGSNSRFYGSERHSVGGKIHMAAVRADAADTIRQHLYYFVYDPTTGAVENFDGSVSTSSGSLPVNLTTANASYRLIDSGSDNLDIPSLQFDGSGRAHLLFTRGASSPYALQHMYLDSGTWTSPATIASINDNFPMYGYNDSVALIPAGGDVMWALYHDSSQNMVRKIWDGSAWGGEEVLVTRGAYPFKQGLAVVLNAHPDLRTLFAENANWSTDADAALLKCYAYGDSGFIEQSIDMSTANPNWNDIVLQLDFNHRNNATTLIDHSLANHAIFTFGGNAKITTSESKFSGAALSLDGTGDYVTVAHSSVFSILGTEDRTFEGFIKINSTGKVHTIFSKRPSAGSSSEWQFQINTSNKLEVVVWASNVVVLQLISTTSVTNGSWYHVEFDWDASTDTGYIFINGNLEASGTASAAPGNNTQVLYIGRDPTNSARDFNGYFGGVRFHQRVLHTTSFTAPSAWPNK